jgi:hypothetical protein
MGLLATYDWSTSESWCNAISVNKITSEFSTDFSEKRTPTRGRNRFCSALIAPGAHAIELIH